MRNWNIRAELRRRAYMYDIENESFHIPEIAIGSSLNKNLPSVMMRSHYDKRYFNGSQRKASDSSEVEERFKICSIVDRSRMIASKQNLQSKKILYKIEKTNGTYNSNKRLCNKKQYCPDPMKLSKNSMDGESSETSMRIFYSNSIHNVSTNCKRTNKSCEDCKDKILKLNRNVIISNSSISDDFHQNQYILRINLRSSKIMNTRGVQN